MTSSDVVVSVNSLAFTMEMKIMSLVDFLRIEGDSLLPFLRLVTGDGKIGFSYWHLKFLVLMCVVFP